MKKWLCSTLSAFLSLAVLSSPFYALAEPSPQDDGQWTETYSADFSGAAGTALDSNWTYDTGNWITDANGNKLSQGWGNNELECYTSGNKNAYLDGNGNLVIEARRESAADQFGTGYNWSSARVKLTGQPMKYGRIDITATLPTGNGLWPAIWMLPADNAYGNWPQSGEIDIMENKGRLPGEVYGTLHSGGVNADKYAGATYTFPGGETVAQQHTYSIEWKPGEIDWYVDGNLYQTQKNWQSYDANGEKYSFPAPFDKPFYLILNLAVGGNFDGGIQPDAGMTDAKMIISSVKQYSLDGGYTAVSSDPAVTADPDPAGAKQPDGTGNLISDGDFSTAPVENAEATGDFGTNWNFVHMATFGGAGTCTTDAIGGKNYAKVNVTNAGTQNYSVQLIQKTTCVKGQWYKLTYDAKSDRAATIQEKVAGGAEAGWAAFSNVNTANLATDFQTFTDTFQMTQASDIQSRLEFELATAAPQTVWIGNVRLEKADAPTVDYNATKPALADGNLVYNGAFDKGVWNRLTYWSLATANGATAGYSVPENTRELNITATDAGSAPADVSVNEQGIQLANGKQYELKFSAHAGQARSMTALLESSGGGTVYAVQTYDISAEKAAQTLDFTMSGASTQNATLVFETGGDATTTYLDDVSLQQTGSTDSNLITNGDFSTDTAGWSTYTQDGASFAATENGGRLKLAVGNTGAVDYSAQIYQDGFRLEQGKTYTVSFKASADTARAIHVNVGKSLSADPWWTAYTDQHVAQLGTTEQEYTYSFTVSQPTDSSCKLVFDIGKISGDASEATNIYIDDVSLRPASDEANIPTQLAADPASNLIRQGTFDTGTAVGADVNSPQSGTYWYQYLGDGATGATTVVGGKLKANITNVGANSWSAQVCQPGFTLTQGRDYLVTFTASAGTARRMNVNIGKPLSSDPYFINYMDTRTFDVGTDEQQYSFVFHCSQPTDPTCKLVFELGNVTGGNTATAVCLDNVAIYPVDLPEIAAPAFSPAGGTYTSAQTVTLACADAHAVLYYTTDGSAPTASSTRYTAPIPVSENKTVRAVAVDGGISSSVSSAAYLFGTPVSTHLGHFTAQLLLSGTTLYITLVPDGASDTATNLWYTNVASPSALSDAVAGYPLGSKDASGNYTIAIPKVQLGANGAVSLFLAAGSGDVTWTAANTAPVSAPAAPAFSPAGGTYTSAQTVTLTCADAHAVLYYTTDGSAPTASSTRYTAPITISSSKTVKAIAVVSGLSSEAASASYVIQSQPSGGSGSGGATVDPSKPIAAGAPDASGAYTAQAPSLSGLSASDHLTFVLGPVSVSLPVSALQSAAQTGGAAPSVSQMTTPAGTLATVQASAPAGTAVVAGFDLRLTSGGAEIHQLGSPATVTVALTADQLARVKAVQNAGLAPVILWYDPGTGAYTDMGAVFDLAAGTATFSTTHFSTYLLATRQAAAAPGVQVTAHVRHLGWLQTVLDGALAGTVNRALQTEAFRIRLTGTLPQGASIVYRAHVRHLGWLGAVSNGAQAGTTGKGLRMEAIQITLNDLPGYAVEYRAYVQHFGWLAWHRTANGTALNSAGIAGTTGRSLRLEALEVRIVKVN